MDAGEFLNAVYDQFRWINDGMVHARLMDVNNSIKRISITFMQGEEIKTSNHLVWRKDEYCVDHIFSNKAGNDLDFRTFNKLDEVKEALKSLSTLGFELDYVSVDFDFRPYLHNCHETRE